MKSALAVPVILFFLGCGAKHSAATGGACPGAVGVTKGLLAGGTPGESMAASAFYSFGPRVVLAGSGCGYIPGGGSTSMIRLNLAKGIGPGTYPFLPDGGSSFQALYSFTSPYYGGYAGAPVSGTLELKVVDPVLGVVEGTYLLDFGGSGFSGGGSLPDGGFVFGTLGELIEEGTFVAPVCDLCGLGETEAPDAGQTPLGAAGLAACDRCYAAQYSRCGGPVLPATENARLLARFEQLCQNQASLPGSGVTAASLETCASDLEASPCGSFPESCNFLGFLPEASSCADGIQCPSGYCIGAVTISPEGQIGPSTCGTCDPVTLVLGQDCGSGGRCPGGSDCYRSGTSAFYTCVAITQGPGGAPCGGTASCQPGSYCAAQTGTCQALAAAGAPCGACAPPLSCGPSKFCVSTQAGEPCDRDADCAPGLGCIPDVAVSGARWVCAPVTWAGPGQPCSATARCLVGSCDFGILGELDFSDGGLAWETCPTVIPDGEPCTVWPFDSTTCDTFSVCFEGACIPIDSVPCY